MRTATGRTALTAAATAIAILAGCGGGSPAADTRLIVFARAPATNAYSDLYILQTDGSLRRLTHGGIDSAPSWSPDGQRIAFLRSHRDGSTALYVANADGGGQRPLAVEASGQPVWSPDSRDVLFTDRDRIWVTNSDWTGRIALVDARPATAGDATWSPDGERIVFVLGPGARRGDVHVVNADGTGLTRLTQLAHAAGQPYSPLWSPDGTRIAFLLAGSLTVMNADGSAPKVLARFANRVFPSSLAWSPDSRTIAFARGSLDGDRRHSGVYLVSRDGGDLHRLTRNIDSTPSWSPDGRKIVFQRLVGFHVSEITLMDRDGSDQVGLTEGGWSDSSPAWRPAGE